MRPLIYLFCLSLPAHLMQAQQIDVLMSQYNPERTGANLQERTLRPANVNPTLFGKLGEWQVDHSIYALPLLANGVNMGGGVRKNLLVAATMANSLYIFDADRPGSPALWQRSLGTPGRSDEWLGQAPPPATPTHGILSTPVIDAVTNTLYVVARVGVGSNLTRLQLNAFDLATGNPKYNSPQAMSFPVAGGVTITDNTGYIQRAALLLSNGVLYVAVANVVIDPEDHLSQEGYVQSFDAADLSRRYGSFQVTPTGLKGGIWQAGRGISVDPQGYLYVATAGGYYDGVDNFGTSILKLNPRTLTVADWFTPANWGYLFENNIDPSANGVTLLPGTSLAVAGGKEGVIYLLNRNNMGKLGEPLQQFKASNGCGLGDCAQTLGTAFWSRPGSPESLLYVWDRRDVLRTYPLNNATQRFNLAAATAGRLRPEMTGGPTISAAAEDPSTGIVWGLTIACCYAYPPDANGLLLPATLHAYRASDITQELYNSDTNPADAVGNFTKFAPPVVANGRVYVVTHSNKVVVYGLRDPKTLTINVSGTGSVTGTPGAIECSAACTFTSDPASTIQLTATPGAGMLLAGWSGACTGTGPCSVTMSENRSVTATFAAATPAPRLDVTKSGTGSGTISGSGINCGSACGLNLPAGTAVTLVATASAGSQFASWITGPCAGSANATCSFTIQANVAASAGFSLLTSNTTGYYFLPINPCRAADTRSGLPVQGQTSRTFNFAPCNVPANAAAVASNVTVVPQESLSYLTIWPAGQTQPVVSTMNSLDARIKANASIVGTGANGGVSVFVTNTSHIILDVFGYFVPKNTPGALAFYPSATPCRLLDTRTSGGALAASETRRINAFGSCLPAQAQAFSLNVTAVPSGPLAYLTLWPDGVTQPLVSTLNNFTGTIVANAAIVPAGTGGALNAFVTNASHLVVDVNGYFAPPGSPGALAFVPVPPCRVADTRNPPGPLGGPSLAAAATREFTVLASACSIPTTAQAYVLNATVVPPSPLTYLTLWPGGAAQPLVSTLNAIDGALTSNAAIVAAGPNGVIRAFASDRTNLVLDVSGYFVPE